MKKIAGKLLKTMVIVALLMYAGLTMCKQEMAFNKYDSEIEKYEKLIKEEEFEKELLVNTRTKISSKEYIEEIAREKLGFVMPNEIVFVDASL